MTEVTVQLDERDAQRAAEAALRRGRSLAEWAAEVIQAAAREAEEYEKAREQALHHLETVRLHLGGGPYRRDELYDRGSRVP